MQNTPGKTSANIVRRSRALGLALIMAAFAFIAARLAANNALYGFPLLLPIVLLAAFHEASVPWSVGVSVSSALLYGFLDMLFHPPDIPLAYFLLSVLSIAATAALAGRLSMALHEKQRHYTEQSAQEQLIAEINTHLLTVTTDEQLYQQTLHHLYNISQRPGVFFISGEEGSLRRAASHPVGLILFPTEAHAAADAFARAEETGFGTPYHRGSSFHYLPIRSNGEVLGVVGLLMNPENPLSPSMLQVLRQMLVRAAVVLEKKKLAERHKEALMESELEQMRSNFLRAISHDFRTPLTSIICACSALSQQDVALDAAAQREMIDNIGEEAQWLLRMVENLLSVTRADMGGPKLNRSLEPVEEVLSGIIEKTQARFPQAELSLTLPDEFLMIPMNPLLIVQVLMNLIENAVKYAAPEKRVDLAVESLADSVRFSVRDYGKGLSVQDTETLFTLSAMRAGDVRNGMGMGLAICRSVVRAHGGEIWVENNPGGGARFTFTLPKEAS